MSAILDSESGRQFVWREEYNRHGELACYVLGDPDWYPATRYLFDFGIIGIECNADVGLGWPLLLHCGCRWRYGKDRELQLSTVGCKAGHVARM